MSSLSEPELQAVGTVRVDAAVLTTSVHVHVDDAIAPSTSELDLNDIVPAVVPAVDAESDDEPSDWWWDHQFNVHSEERLGRYGV